MNTPNNPLVSSAQEAMKGAGIQHYALVSETFSAHDFGNGEAIFSLGAVLLRFVRDRGQEFLDIGAGIDPGTFCNVQDVERALSWPSIADARTRPMPEPIVDVLARIAPRLQELQAAMSPARAKTTLGLVQAAERNRRQDR